MESFNDLTIFTTTFYKDDPVSKVRSPLAVKLVQNTQKLGAHCVVVDGGSTDLFLNEIRAMSGVTLVVDPSLKMGESRRKALELGHTLYKTPYYLWVEPEKDDLIKPESLSAMLHDLREGKADIVVPKRMSFETLPKFQADMENRANRRASRLTYGVQEMNEEHNLDLWFGPKMFNERGASFFQNYRGALDKWDAIIKPVIDAYKAGCHVQSVPVDYRYDESQSNSETGDVAMKRKRLEQYATILRELGDTFWKRKIDDGEIHIDTYLKR